MTRFVEFSALGGSEILRIVEGDVTPLGPGEVQIWTVIQVAGRHGLLRRASTKWTSKSPDR